MKPVLPASNATMENRYDRTEGISGSAQHDILVGTDDTELSMLGNELTGNDMVWYGM